MIPMRQKAHLKILSKKPILFYARTPTEIDTTETDNPEGTISPNEDPIINPKPSMNEEGKDIPPENSDPATIPENDQGAEQSGEPDGEDPLTVDDEMTTEIEQMMSEIMEEMANSEDNTLELALEVEAEEEEEDDFTLKGNIEYSYVLTMWDSPNRNIFHVAQFSGDPQYLFQQTEQWGYTVGARFLVTGTEHLLQQYYNSLIGVTGGLQYGAFRINTSASWMWEQYFAQKEIDRADGFITYQYDELAAMSGVLWENTLTYSPDDMDFGVQASVGFPFQVNGERDMGQAFKDSWQVGTRLSLSVFQLVHRLSRSFHSANSDRLRNFVLIKSEK